jgi:hypothetical protein
VSITSEYTGTVDVQNDLIAALLDLTEDAVIWLMKGKHYLATNP